MVRRILIVDDNEAIRQALRQLFQAEDCFEICGEAVDGEGAIAKAEQLNPDLIVLDLSMPGMNGMEAARVLRQTKPEIPIILFTLHGDPGLRSAASAIGIRAVVAKTELDALVGRALAVLKGKAPTVVSGQQN